MNAEDRRLAYELQRGIEQLASALLDTNDPAQHAWLKAQIAEAQALRDRLTGEEGPV